MLSRRKLLYIYHANLTVHKPTNKFGVLSIKGHDNNIKAHRGSPLGEPTGVGGSHCQLAQRERERERPLLSLSSPCQQEQKMVGLAWNCHVTRQLESSWLDSPHPRAYVTLTPCSPASLIRTRGDVHEGSRLGPKTHRNLTVRTDVSPSSNWERGCGRILSLGPAHESGITMKLRNWHRSAVQAFLNVAKEKLVNYLTISILLKLSYAQMVKFAIET